MTCTHCRELCCLYDYTQKKDANDGQEQTISLSRVRLSNNISY